MTDAQTSEERRFYSAGYPSPATVNSTNGVFVSFDELKRLFPDRVLLARIDEIFLAWFKEMSALPLEKRYVCDKLPQKQEHIVYKYDKYEYMAGAYTIDLLNRKPQFCIKLANAGFLYSSATTLETDPSYDDSYSYHGSTGWSLLSNGTLNAHFTSVLRFAEQFFKGEEVECYLLYNEKEERIDFRFMVCDKSKDNVRLVITFEPGYPCHWHDEDKWWGKIYFP